MIVPVGGGSRWRECFIETGVTTAIPVGHIVVVLCSGFTGNRERSLPRFVRCSGGCRMCCGGWAADLSRYLVGIPTWVNLNAVLQQVCTRVPPGTRIP
eukprot:405067-Rhodomonas_salina.2